MYIVSKKIIAGIIAIVLIVLAGGTYVLGKKGYIGKKKVETIVCRDSLAVEKAKPYVVRVQAKAQDKTIYGTGFWDENGNIITNSHVVDLENADITIMEADSTTSKARLIGNNVYKDLAILAVDGKTVNGIKWGQSSELKEPDTLIAIGYSLNLPGESSITKGSFSARRTYESVNYIQTDTALNPGNSGGPLIDTCGNLVGINTYASDNATVNIAISSESAKSIVADLKISQKVSYATGERKTVLSELLKAVGMETFTQDQGLDDATKAAESNTTASKKNSATSSSSSASTKKPANGNNNTPTTPPNQSLLPKPVCTYFSADGMYPNTNELEINQTITLRFSTSAPTTGLNITWSGGGTFSNESNASANWKSNQAGEYTLTATASNSAGECSKSTTVNVLTPITRIEGLRKITMINLFEPTYSKTLGKEAIRIGIGYQSETGSDLSWNMPRSGIMAISADVTVKDYSTNTKTIYSGHFSNSQIGHMFESASGPYREILIPRDAFNVSDSEYIDNRYDCNITLTIHTPEQGDFTSTGNGSLLKY